MPLYEYVCESCHHAFEALVFGNEGVECPECKGAKLERQMSLPGQPKVAPSGTSLPTACQSSGPPCGPVCGRWQNN